MAQAPKNVPLCGRADTLLGLQEAKELGSTWGAGQRGVGAEFSQGRVSENRGPQQDCQQLAGSGATWGQGQGTIGGRLWEGNVPFCVLGSCTPYSPSTMTSRAEMTVSSCRALRQGRGEIQSEGGILQHQCGVERKTVCVVAHSCPAIVGAGKQKPGLVRGGKTSDSPCRAGQDSLCGAQREVPGEHQ